MARPARTDRPVKKNLQLPESIVGRVDLMLYSELEQRVPHAAWSNYIAELIRADLAKRVNGLTVKELLSG